MIDALTDEARLVIRARLEPVVGSTFQPTGFPDLGPAEFERPGSEDGAGRALLVDSVQALANHLEAVGWDGPAQRPVQELEGLPYVEVRDTQGRFLTSSRLEPHRLAGAYIRAATIDGASAGDWLIECLAVEKGVPTDWRQVYAAIFSLDPMCLLHGVFFSAPAWRDYGNPKVRRAITAVIEAHGARPVISGGVKRDDVNPAIAEGRGTAEGYGFVPFGRTEYTAEAIWLDAAVDLAQIRGYGLPRNHADLLVSLALWELTALLERPLRPRTACDFVVSAVEVRRPAGIAALPDRAALAQEIAGAASGLSTAGPATVVWG